MSALGNSKFPFAQIMPLIRSSFATFIIKYDCNTSYSFALGELRVSKHVIDFGDIVLEDFSSVVKFQDLTKLARSLTHASL